MRAEQHAGHHGSVALYIALVILTMFVSTALIIGGIATKQIQASRSTVKSERAFYAANSGVEEALWQLAELNNTSGGLGPVEIVDGEVPYDDGRASYDVRAILVVDETGVTARPCVESAGEFGEEKRRVALRVGTTECAFE